MFTQSALIMWGSAWVAKLNVRRLSFTAGSGSKLSAILAP